LVAGRIFAPLERLLGRGVIAEVVGALVSKREILCPILFRRYALSPASRHGRTSIRESGWPEHLCGPVSLADLKLRGPQEAGATRRDEREPGDRNAKQQDQGPRNEEQPVLESAEEIVAGRWGGHEQLAAHHEREKASPSGLWMRIPRASEAKGRRTLDLTVFMATPHVPRTTDLGRRAGHSEA
jgi:hypothetical protein